MVVCNKRHKRQKKMIGPRSVGLLRVRGETRRPRIVAQPGRATDTSIARDDYSMYFITCMKVGRRLLGHLNHVTHLFGFPNLGLKTLGNNERATTTHPKTKKSIIMSLSSPEQSALRPASVSEGAFRHLLHIPIYKQNNAQP